MKKWSQDVVVVAVVWLFCLFIWLCCVLVAVCRLSSWANGLSCPVARGILVPWPQIEPPYPVLQGRFLATGPRGKSHNKRVFKWKQITNSVYMGWRVSPWIHVLPDSQNHNLCRCSHNRFSCLVAKLCLTLLWPHGLYPTRLFCPWDFPGKNTGVGCQALLQGIFPTQGLNPGLPHCRWSLYRLSQQGSPPFFKLNS